MTLTLAVRVLAVSVLAVGASAQQQGGQYALGGTVTNSRTGEPVKRALVTALHYNAPGVGARGSDGRFVPPPPPLTLAAFTDSAGVFWFNGLAPGDYSVSAQKPGFQTKLPDDLGAATGQVKLTASMTDLRLSLAPLVGAVLSTALSCQGAEIYRVDGAVVNTRTGAPLPRAHVSVSRNVSGATLTSMVTGEDGKFSFDLPEGKYALRGGTARYA